MSFGQTDSTKPLTFKFHEIQIFTGLTNSGTHIIKLDNSSLILKKMNYFDSSGVKIKVVNFRELEGRNLKSFRKAFTALLKYLDEFNYKTYKALTEKKELTVTNKDTVIREKIISSHDLGTRILFIDNEFNSYFIRYYFCEEELDELVKRINKLIPENLRQEYSIQKRCVKQ